ncbi:MULTISPECIES: glycosyltransferase [Comamonadaceae]|uniref:glycosyltransferase n=1 Tax=Comamonadaceae TaxID=80864 RepID=UPI00271B0A31|nr:MULTISPECIES: glycosyltransferase [Comamonadaceae]MDO9145870.1 glycosyltransferase [Rhodoferax sp.]MDP3887611.1 glycosyltransferase [Hydrogenophaga sp.]
MQISIALATFNGSKYLNDQLISLACQKLLPYEVIVVDDGSTDETLEIVKNFASNVSFPVRIYKNETKLGYGLNFLKAAGFCSGDAIAFCDQDDEWSPDKLVRVVEAIMVHKADFVVHSAEVVNETLNFTGSRYHDIVKDNIFGSEILREKFYPGFAISITKRFFTNLKKITMQQGFFVDAHDEFICEHAERGWRRYEISKSLVNYRQHQSNLIGYHDAIKKQRVA